MMYLSVPRFPQNRTFGGVPNRLDYKNGPTPRRVSPVRARHRDHVTDTDQSRTWSPCPRLLEAGITTGHRVCGGRFPGFLPQHPATVP